MTGFGETLNIERGPLLNFWYAPIFMNHPHEADAQLAYPTNEHYFQACKTMALIDPSGAVEIHEQIAVCPTPFDAKRLGRGLRIAPEKWDKISLKCMKAANLAKFQQHRYPRDELLGTGMTRLVEHRPDPIWGDNMDGSGRNLQGRVLMEVRARLRELHLDDIQKQMIRRVAGEIDADVASEEALVCQAEIAIMEGIRSEAAIKVLNIAGLAPDSALERARA